MKLIIGQGNPEQKYDGTRHNVGFAALDYYARQVDALFTNKPKFVAAVAELSHSGENVLLVKPQTYYNDTGIAARALVDFYKIDTTDILVIHDELALPFGTVRSRMSGRDAGNNGIKSLNAHLGQDYARVRVGITNDITEVQGAFDFVLSRFTADESTALHNAIFPQAQEIIRSFISGTHKPSSYTL